MAGRPKAERSPQSRSRKISVNLTEKEFELVEEVRRRMGLRYNADVVRALTRGGILGILKNVSLED